MFKRLRKGIRGARKSIRTLRERVVGTRVPELAAAQPEHLAHLLPYEAAVEYEGCSVIVLSDGSLGLAWALALVGHEALTAAQLSNHVEAVVHALDAVATDRATCQLIWDSTPTTRFAAPPYENEPSTYAQQVMKERIQFIRSLAAPGAPSGLRCQRRQLWLTLRWQREGRLGLDDKVPGLLTGDAASTLGVFHDRLQVDLRELRETATLLEEGLRSAGVVAKRLDAAAFLDLVRTGFHSTAARNRGWVDYNKDEHLGSQAAVEFATCTPSAIQLGDIEADTLQVLSWAQKPSLAYNGMLAFLLQVQEPIRVVVNIRACKGLGDLDFKEFVLRLALDAVGRRQYEDIKETQRRLAHNQKAFWVGMHVIVRNEKCTIPELLMRNAGQLVANRLRQWIGIPFLLETHAAPLMYQQCLPLGYTPKSGVYTQRERRVLTGELAKYLPMYSGFAGVSTKAQLMLSRAGEPIYLSSRDCPTSQHMAVLASTGGGKSFWLANMLVGDRALYPRSLDFIIDNKTSYEVLAKVLGEEGGFALSKPPVTFPNIFLGALDDDRLRIMVSILRTAIMLASPRAELTAEHSLILGLAIRKTFEANYVDAATSLVAGTLVRRTPEMVHVPRLSQVCDKFVQVCQERDLPLDYASFLRAKLSPFVGQGPYATVFDRECVAPAEAPTPAVTLIDLDGVADDPILCTLTAQITISDIIRQVKRKENAGRKGRLVIEEVGLLGQRNPELVSFVQAAWKTFRKLEYTCIGLTNEVDDYRLKEAARTIWQVSPTKVILPMTRDELAKAGAEDRTSGVPKLIHDDHVLQLLGTLRKRDGVYSQGLWLGDVVGTFCYAPTGYDYWLAASKEAEVASVDRLAAALGGSARYWRALDWLARHKPSGFRDSDGKVRAMTDQELRAAASEMTAADETEAAA